MSKLRLKYIRPTLKMYEHNDVYYGEQYLGYIIKGVYSGDWHFETKSKIPYLKADTRNALLTKLTKTIEESMKHKTPEDIYLSKIADLEIALDAAIMQCKTLQEEIAQLQEENKILIDTQKFADGVW